MSHVMTIDPNENYDIDALKHMCKNQKWEFRQGQKHFGWFGSYVGDYPLPEGFTEEDMGHCSHAIHIPGYSYEIGVVKKNNKWKLLYDFWKGGRLNEKVGESGGLLKQAYGIAKTELTCKSKNRTWTKETLKSKPGWKKITINMPA